jgi:hypothetical protein
MTKSLDQLVLMTAVNDANPFTAVLDRVSLVGKVALMLGPLRLSRNPLR